MNIYHLSIFIYCLFNFFLMHIFVFIHVLNYTRIRSLSPLVSVINRVPMTHVCWLFSFSGESAYKCVFGYLSLSSKESARPSGYMQICIVIKQKTYFTFSTAFNLSSDPTFSWIELVYSNIFTLLTCPKVRRKKD